MKFDLKKTILVFTALSAIQLGTSTVWIEKAVAETIQIDGSSTVYPISEAVAEEFGRVNRKDHVTIGISGTGGGFKKFCNSETDISDASRPIKETEVKKCKAQGIDYIELPVAFDGLAVIANPKNDWIDSMTVSELKKIWEPSAKGKITRWNQINPAWPNKDILLYGPGTDSGTFDYFTKVINGKEGASRSDYTASEDDNILVHGIAGDKYALGYFGLAYYAENKDKLKLIGIDNEDGRGAVLPSLETVSQGTYRPLSRPIFIYINKKSAERPEVKQFVEFYLSQAAGLSEEVGYVPLPKSTYNLALSRFKSRKTGTVFTKKGKNVGVSIETLMIAGE